MRRAADILKDLGFNEQSPESTKQAFVRHLMAAARQTPTAQPLKTQDRQPQVEAEKGEQLSFSFDQPIRKSS